MKTFCIVGRSPQAHLAVDDHRLAPRHLQVRSMRGRVEVNDLVGGLRVNELPFQTATLADGDVLSVGRTKIRVRIEQEASAAAAVSLPVAASPGGPTGQVLPRLTDAKEEGERRLFLLGDSAFDEPKTERPAFPPPPGLGRGELKFTGLPGFTPSHPDRLLYAVADSARCVQLAFKAKLKGYTPVSLFIGEMAPQMADLAPYFFAVPAGAKYLADWQAARGENAGVLIDSPAPANEVFDHLRFVFVVQDETEQEFFFRFYDPRALRTYLPTCTTEELKTFFGPVRTWICENAAGDGYLAYSVNEEGKLREQVLGSIQLEKLA